MKKADGMAMSSGVGAGDAPLQAAARIAHSSHAALGMLVARALPAGLEACGRMRTYFCANPNGMNMDLQKKKSGYARLALLAACALLAISGAVGPLSAQSTPDSQEPQKQDPQSSPPAATPAAAGPAEGFTLGAYQGHSDFEIGYRWIPDSAGNEQMYRSMINLGEGPKLFHAGVSLRSKYGTGKLFDSLNLSMDNWGGEPYSSLRLDFGKTGAYEFRADYRHMDYYNYVPTWANPLLNPGSLVSQHGLDTSYRTLDLQLTFFPTHKMQPYVAYSRTTGYGPGLTTYSLTGNEFLLDRQWHYASDDYRGGVLISLPRLSLTLEQGYRFLKNDSNAIEDGAPQGNHPVPFVGNPVVMDSLNRSYHERTTLPVSKALIKFTPFEMLSITGRYIYTMSDLESDLGEIDTGSFVSLENRLIYSASSDAFSTRAKQPNHNGSFLVEFSPSPYLTVLNQFQDRSFHISGSAVLASTFFDASSLVGPFGGTSDQEITSVLNSLLAYDQLSNQTEIEGRLAWGLAARGGFRYDSVSTALQESDDTEPTAAWYNRRTGIIGLDYTRGRWLRLSADYERNLSSHAIMRTDLFDYDQVKFDGKVAVGSKVTIHGRVAVLTNRNDASDIDLRAHNRNYSIALNYDPSERFSLSLDYSRTNIFSDIAILLPQTLQLDRSLFDERGHGIGGSMGIGICRWSRLDFGYRGILNAGSMALNYHMPYASLSIPLPEHMSVRSQWQWFGYNEKGTNLQDHRTHLVTLSLAYQR
jgi:hypothetical protein